MSRQAAIERWLNRVWYPADGAGAGLAGGLFGLLLSPLCWLFALVVRFRRTVYALGLARAGRAARPVVVIGNISVGGTGKTPMTVYLANALRERGLRVGIVTRGYRSRSRPPSVVRVRPDSDPVEVGDEAVMLATQSGAVVVAGRDRLAAARLLEAEVDLILADDGLQHLRLARDLEIVLVDGERGLGNRRLLPCGPLREPPRRLAQADFVILTGASDRAFGGGDGEIPRIRGGEGNLRAVARSAGAVSLIDNRRLPLDAFVGQQVHAVAGIANPGRFFALLRNAGIGVIEHALPDHASITPATVAFDDGRPVLMTDKDAVKCRSFADARCWAIHLDVDIEEPGRAALLKAIGELVTKQC
jgi:tetraacyldisaccharide 4'-kinase